jgi:hypothetical protein
MTQNRESPAEVPERSPQVRPPFWRAILIGLLIIPLSTYFGNYAYVVTQAMLWGQTSLLRGPVFILFALSLLNILYRKVFRRAGLRPSEMLVIYSMVALSVCISGYGQVQWLVNILPAGGYFPTTSNHYAQFLFRVPAYLVPHDPAVIADFYRGHSTMYRPEVIRDWSVPVAVWSAFLLVVCWVSLCVTSLIRRSWTDDEKLTFPLVQLPLEMADGASGNTPFFKNRLMWAGFLVAGLLETIDYIHFFVPGFPYVPIKPSDWHLEQYMVSEPWNSIGVFTLAFYPFAIGIAFLLSCEVSFSCAFFYLVTKFENVATSALGLNQGSGVNSQAPFLGEQGVGAFVALAVFLLWRAREPIADACRSAWDKRLAAATDDPSAPISPRVAFWGGLAGIAAIVAFLHTIGLPVWLALVFWSIYLLFLVVLTRIFAEAGAGWAWGPLVNVHNAMFDVAGVKSFDARSLTMFGYLDWFDNEMRDSPMPHQLEAMKMGQETDTPRRQLRWGLLLAMAVSGVVAFWAHLHMYYEYGAASAKVRPALQGLGPNHLAEISNWLYHPKPVDHRSLGGMVAGAVIVLALANLRQSFVWWPLHPIGYALAGTQSMEYMWCPFLIAWAIKACVLRYGGIKVYRRVLPFFLGLILGDYIVPTLWGIWGGFAHTQVYMSFPH